LLNTKIPNKVLYKDANAVSAIKQVPYAMLPSGLLLPQKHDRDGILLTQVTSNNTELVSETTITWNGIKLFDSVEIPVTLKDGIMISIDNSDTASELTATLEVEFAADDWRQLYTDAGTAVSFTVPASKKYIYGPFEKFPRYLSGRIVLTAAVEPTDTKLTKVQVQEV